MSTIEISGSWTDELAPCSVEEKSYLKDGEKDKTIHNTRKKNVEDFWKEEEAN